MDDISDAKREIESLRAELEAVKKENSDMKELWGEMLERYGSYKEQLTTCQQQRDELVSAFIVLWVSQDVNERSKWDAKAVERFDALLAKLGADKTGEGS